MLNPGRKRLSILPRWAQRALSELTAELDRERAEHARTREALAAGSEAETVSVLLDGLGEVAAANGRPLVLYVTSGTLGVIERKAVLTPGDRVFVGRDER